MTRQTALGILFLALGLLLVGIAVAPVVALLIAHQPAPAVTTVFVAFILVGVVTAIFGGFLLPSSGVPAATTQLITIAGPYIPRFPGVSRVGDPPSLPPAGGDKP
jgi:hypothetical protein